MSSAEAADLPKKKKSNKDYSNTTRVYDSDGYRLRADALIFKDERKQEVCYTIYNEKYFSDQHFSYIVHVLTWRA